MRAFRHRRIELLVFLASGAGLLASLGRLFGAGLVDDAYIFLRYADNLARGVGAVFNEGERVEGFSSVSWTLMLAGARLLTSRLELAALILSAASVICLCALVNDWLNRYTPEADRWTNWFLALGLLSLPAMVYWGLSGMEQVFFSLVVSAVLISVWADDQRQSLSTRTVLLLIAALLARPEGLLLLAWIAAFLTLRYGRLDGHWLRHVAAPLGIVLAALGLLYAVRYAYFGSIVPNTYYAKVTPGWLGRARSGATYLQRCLIAHSPLLILGAVLFRSAAKRGTVPKPGVALLLGWIGVWCAYVEWAGGDHFGMFRFFLPALPALILLVGILWKSIRQHLPGAQALYFRGALLVAFGISIFTSLNIDGPKARREPVAAHAWAAAGKWIAENTSPHTLVATNVIGAIGYFSRRPIVDMAGLVDRVVAREGKIFPAAAQGHARYNTDYIFARAPDLVVYYTSGMVGESPFTHPDQLLPTWHISLIDFVRDARCAQRYEHIAVRLADGTWLEMQKKRTFPLLHSYFSESPTAARGRPSLEKAIVLPVR